MRGKAPLALMEQLVMVLVFALAAALCVQAFAASNRISQKAADIDRAVQLAQSAAEIMKSCGGDMTQAQRAAMERMGGQISGNVWCVLYDRDWNEISDGKDESAAYRLETFPDSHKAQMEARVRVSTGSGEVLLEFPVVWQEADSDA